MNEISFGADSINLDNIFVIQTKTEINDDFIKSFNEKLTMEKRKIRTELSALLTPDYRDKDYCLFAEIVPEGVKKLSLWQFKNQAKVERIYIPASVEELEFLVFEETKAKLPNRNVWVEISKDNPKYVSIEGSVYTKDLSKLVYLYESADKQTQILDDCRIISAYTLITVDENFHFPKKLELIDVKALRAVDINSISIPNGVKILGEDFVVSEKKLTVEIPASVEVIEKNQVNYIISDDNQNFTLVENCIYSKNKDVFFQGYSNDSLKIIDGCKEIDLSKCECSRLLIPSSVEKIYGNHESNFKFEVSEDNKNFSSYSNSLYSKDYSILLDYSVPVNNEIIIHPACKKIQSGALDIQHFKYLKRKHGIHVKKISIPAILEKDEVYLVLKKRFV